MIAEKHKFWSIIEIWSKIEISAKNWNFGNKLYLFAFWNRKCYHDLNMVGTLRS